MLESLKGQLLGTLEPNIVYLCLAMIAVLIVLTLIKKAIKFAVVLVVFAVAMYSLVPMAKDFQNNYKFSVDSDGVLTITVDGKDLVLDNSEPESKYDDESRVEKLTVQKQSDGDYHLNIVYTDGSTQKFVVPSFMRSNLINYLNKQEYDYKLLE